jgi:hypothetical protein
LNTRTAIRPTFDVELYWRVRIGELSCVAHRWPECPLHVVEILSDQHLRDRFGWRDGDAVEVEFSNSDIAPMPVSVWLAWQMVWRGRERAFYGDYRKLAQPIPFLYRLSLQPVPK